MADALIAFGTWVWLRRQALVLSREELARRVGCAEVTIRKIEADERRLSPQITELLAVHLGVSEEQHELFVRVARGMVAASHLSPPIPGAGVVLAVDAGSNPLPAKAPLPSGTVTFLFTDIEGSTRRWEEQPDAMRLALVRHNVLLQEAVEAHHGQVFKTVEDAICAAFTAASDALAAAIAGQRMLVPVDWGVLEPICVRMALHTGTAKPHNTVAGLVNRQIRSRLPW